MSSSVKANKRKREQSLSLSLLSSKQGTITGYRYEITPKLFVYINNIILRFEKFVKKLATLVPVLVFILALTACDEAKGRENPLRGVAVSNMPTNGASTAEIKRSQPASLLILIEAHELTTEETEQTIEMIGNGS